MNRVLQAPASGSQRQRCGLVGCGLALALAMLASVVAAAAPECDVTVGFGGTWRTGAWTPLVLSAKSEAADGLRAGDVLHVWAEDPDGQFVRSPPGLVAVGPDGVPTARFCVRFGRPSGRLRIDHAPAGQGTASAHGSSGEIRLAEPVPSTDRLLLVYGDLPVMERAARLLARDDGAKSRVIAISAEDRGTAAGSSGRDYDAADVIVVCGRFIETLDPSSVAGIDEWVRRGGRMIFIAGESAAALYEQAGAAASWLPGRVDRLVTLKRLGGLEAHARAGKLPARVTAVRVPLFAGDGPLDGVVDMFEGGAATELPLLVRRAHGLGTITWLGVDVDDQLFRDWQGCDSLLAGLLGGRSRSAAVSAAEPPSRVSDLANQLRVALERFAPASAAPPVSPVPFEIVAALGLLYLLCLYPLDWWLVSRGGGRPWLAWISLPAVVMAFTGLAWAVNGVRQPVEARLLSGAEVVDLDAATGLVRGMAWSAVYDSRNERLDVEADVSPAAADRAVTWFGDAGRGFGAVDAAMPHPSLAAADYAYGGSLAVLDDVPVAASSSRLFEADWFGAVEPSGIVTSTLARDDQDTLRGAVAHHLPFPLVDCRLVHGGWLYDVGRLEPGQRYDTTLGRGPRSLAAAITRRSAAKERDVARRWDSSETDVERILEVAGFHGAAGGSGYTGLEPGRLGRLDLTPLAEVDRAVLVGFADRGQATWRVSGLQLADRGRYRIVIPLRPGVAPASGSAAEPAEGQAER